VVCPSPGEAAAGRKAGRPAEENCSSPAGLPIGLLAFLLLALCPVNELAGQTSAPLVTLTNSAWRFDDTATDLGTTWRAVSYPAENQWPSGRGLFGVESTVPSPYAEPVGTPLVLNAGRTTYYFRTHFNFTGVAAGLTLQATAYVDDGAVFHLNGSELHRVRLPAGPIAFTNKAELASPEGVPVVFTFPATRLAQGDNVLAVEVHQHSDTSSDVIFGLALDVLATQAPVIVDPAEPADRAVPEGESTTLEVVASAFPAPAYQWYYIADCGLPIADCPPSAIANAQSATLTLMNLSADQAGNYFCRVTNSSGAITSRTAIVTFLADTNPLTILYALGRESPNEILVAFSEPPNRDEAEDVFFWQIEDIDAGTSLTVVGGGLSSSSDSMLVLTTVEPRDPNHRHLLRRTEILREQVDRGNIMPAGTEAPIASFVAPLIPNDDTHVWRYDQSGSDLSADWLSPGYDDAGWPTDAGPFDAFRIGPTVCRPALPGINPPDDLVRTCLTLSNAANTALIPTIYFRTRFNFAGDTTYSLLRLQTIVNDGAVFYLNGVELTRLGMPEGPVSYNTPARGWAGPPAFTELDVDAPSLVAGENLLAVELHQADLSDSLANRDFTFALKLFAVLPSRPAPRLSVQMAGGNLIVRWAPEAGLLESADDPSGPWTTVLEAHPPGQYVIPPGAAKKFYRVLAP
jgi:hypothetical protein